MKLPLFLTSALVLLLLPATAQAGPIGGSLDLFNGGAYDTSVPGPPVLAPLYVIPALGTLNDFDGAFLVTYSGAVGLTLGFDLSGVSLDTRAVADGGGTYAVFFAFDGTTPIELGALNAPGATGFLTATIVGGSLVGLSGPVIFSGNLAPVPEPSTLVLFGLGLLAAGRAARKRRLALSEA